MIGFYEQLAKGGWVMVPIGLISVLSLGIFLERLYTLRRSRIFPETFIERVQAFIRRGRISEALVLCEQNASSMALVIAAGLLRAGQSRARIQEAVQERGRIEAGRLDRFLEGLGTIAAIAPLLGLLGTVLGMIDVFKQVDASTQAGAMGVNPGALASGIWKALITTAAGLTVAIPTFVGYKYLATRINRIILDMEESGAALVDLLAPEGMVPAAPGGRPGEEAAPEESGNDAAARGARAASPAARVEAEQAGSHAEVPSGASGASRDGDPGASDGDEKRERP